MDSPHENMQSLPEDAEALRALILATFAERDAAVSERDTLLAQNDRLRHLLLKLTRCISAPARSVCRRSSCNWAWKPSSRRSPRKMRRRKAGSRAAQRQCGQAAGEPRRATDAPATDRGDANARGHRVSLLPGNHDGDRRGHLGTAGCEIEAGIRGHSAADRLAVRQVESRPLVTELRVWFEAQIAKLPPRGPTAEAIRYALNHWDGLARFVDDGRIELDTNSVERAMRPVCLSRKNSLFAGSDEGGENWACLASLIETCKLNQVSPQAYFTGLLTRLVNGWPQKRIDELMPWNWMPEQPP
jgi:transposase IS66 family protein/transposase IS66-like protein